jgi:cytochrome P450
MVERSPHIPPDRVVSFDPYRDPARTADPFSVFEEFRDKPLLWSPRYGGFWIATSAEIVRAVYQNPELFSSRLTGIPAGTFWPRPLIPLELDPPEHRKYRKVLVQPFSAPAISRHEIAMRDACTKIVSELAPQGACEFVSDFAHQFPTVVFIDQLFGFPREMAADFVRWNFTLLHGATVAERSAQSEQLITFLQSAIDARSKSSNGGDIISHLLRSSVDGRLLTREEVLDTAFLLFLAGLDTVATAMSFAFHYLAGHPAERCALIADRSLIPGAVEELLRYHAFVSNTRTVTRDAAFYGVELKAGDRMHLPAPVAGRDPAEFQDAHRVDFARKPNRHMTFGLGPHRCIGLHLAALELRVALEVWHDFIPDYELASHDPPSFRAGTILGIDKLPLAWDR